MNAMLTAVLFPPNLAPALQLGKLYEVFAVVLEAYEERRAERMKRMASEVCICGLVG